MDPLPIEELAEVVQGRWVPFSPGPNPRGSARPGLQVVYGVSTDSRSISPGNLFVPLRGERFDGHDFIPRVAPVARAAFVAADYLPEVASRIREAREGFGFIVVGDPLDALERLAAWHRRRLSARVVAVTGSVGKTTVKEFLARLLSRSYETVRAPKSYNNRLGVALTLLEAGRSTRFVVLEMGTSAPGEIGKLSQVASPDLAILTGVAPAHLEGLKDLEGVAREKAGVFGSFSPGGAAFIPFPIFGEKYFLESAWKVSAEVIRFGWFQEGRCGGYWITRCEPLCFSRPLSGGPKRPGFLFEVNHRKRFELPLPGRHNVYNALAAFAVAREIGMDWETLQKGVRELKLPPLRLEIHEAAGVTVIDDTYNANPASLEAALEAVRDLPIGPAGRWFLVLGNLLELGAASKEIHRRVGEGLARSRFFEKVWTFGDEAREAALAARAGGLPADAGTLGDMEAVVGELGKVLRPGDGVLFKGSRGVALDRAASRLREFLASSAPVRNEIDGEKDHALLSV